MRKTSRLERKNKGKGLELIFSKNLKQTITHPLPVFVMLLLLLLLMLEEDFPPVCMSNDTKIAQFG
jgi:hypothetical protein